MKSLKICFLAIALLLIAGVSSINAQDEESSSSVDAGLDFYSSYIWRGAKFGNGAALQPWMEGSVGGLAIGAWGSVSTGGLSDIAVDGTVTSPEALEMDLYIGYSFDFGLGINVTDYYFGGDWLTFDKNHYIEPALSYETGNLSLLGAYMFSPDFSDGDMYFEAGYSLGVVDLVLGAGDGAYTDDGDFMLCNMTVGTSKEIEITDKFTLPLSAGVTLNPSTGGFFIYAGVSF